MAKHRSARTQANDSAVTAPPQPKDVLPTEDDIRRRAYERYLARGAGDGMDFEDWLDAERELRGQKVEGRRQKAAG